MIKMRAVPILMVHSNVNVKLVIQGMGIHARVIIRRFQRTKLIFGRFLLTPIQDSTHALIVLLFYSSEGKNELRIYFY